MRPYYQDDSCTIYHGDCREILPSIEPDSVDLVLTDPPFNVGFDYHNGFNDRLPLEEYGNWLRECISLSESLLRPGAWNFWWMAMRHCHMWGEWFPEGWRIFAALKDFVQVNTSLLPQCWDPVIFWQSGKVSRQKRKAVASQRDYHMGRTSHWVTDGFKGHPCRRPLDTAQHIMGAASDVGQDTLDPFMGSGTTLLAAKNLNRKATGIEIEEKYCEIAARRLQQEVLPLETA